MKTYAFLLAAAVAACPARAPAQSRYTPPPPAALSADLASPWILQLRRNPVSGPVAGPRYQVEVAPPVVRTRPRHAAVPSFTPLHADPARRNRQWAQPASLQKPAKPKTREMDPKYEMQVVAYDTSEPAGTIVIDTASRFLYLVGGDGTARRYGIGVGREGFEWNGTQRISRKAEWPGWTPPPEMIEREAANGKILPQYMEGGPDNPLGARALYLGDTLYRIHGTNQPWTIGRAVSSGCIRMRNEDVIDLYERVRIGARVIVG